MDTFDLNIIFWLLVAFLFDQTVHLEQKDDDLWQAAKKDFAKRTQEYLRKNPISNELRSFIEEIKLGNKRRKRQDHSNMYAIKDGDLVPLEKLEESLQSKSNLGENFTVVPLIIPIALENNMTLKDSTTTEDDSSLLSGSSDRAILGRGKAAKDEKRGQDAAENCEEDSTTEETVVDNLIDDKLKSTSVSSELNRVLEDVQSLINFQRRGKFSSKDGALCNVSGYWDSEVGGMTFYIKNEVSCTNIKMKPQEPPSEEGFIPMDKWNISAKIPFSQASQIIITLTAIKGRKVAIFLGECRICDGSETITGDWLMGRTSSGCKDQKASHSFLSDVFRKNNVETLREAHMKKISNLTTTTTVGAT